MLSLIQYKNYQDVDYCVCKLSHLGMSLTTYVYWVDGMLVNSGPSTFQRGIDDFCAKRRLNKIVHTHFHEDHTGNTCYLTNKYNIPAYLTPVSSEESSQNTKIPLYRSVFLDKPLPFNHLPLPQYIINENTSWEVILTLGHTDSHVAFLDKKAGRLFTGDLYLYHKIKENIPVLMVSLRKLLAKEFDTIFCSHSGVMKNGHKLLKHTLENMEELKAEVFHLHSQGLSTKEINRKIYPKRNLITYLSNNEWSSYHLIQSLLEESQNI